MKLFVIIEAIQNLWRRRRTVRVLVGRRAAHWLLVGSVAGVLVAVIEVVLSVQIARMLKMLGVLGAVSASDESGITLGFASILIAIAFSRGILYFLISQSGTNAYENILLRMRLLAFHESFRKESGYVSMARLTFLLGEIFVKASLFCIGVAVVIPSVLQAIVVIAIMFYKSWLLTLVGGFGIGLIGCLVLLANLKVREVAESVPLEYQAMTTRMTRMSRNWFFLRAVRKMDDEHAALVGITGRLAKAWIRCLALGNLAAVMPQSLGVIVLLVMVMLQSSLHPLDATSFVAFLYLFFRLIQALSQLATNLSASNVSFPQFLEALKYIEALDEGGIDQVMSQLKWNSSEREIPYIDPEILRNAKAPSVEFQSVNFRYADQVPFTISDFSLNIQSGEHVALMGPSGAGKSTILALCMGVLRPANGSVKIGNQRPDEYLKTYSRRLGYVGAEPFIVDGTLEENLLYGLDKACSRDELLDVLNRVGLGSWASEQSNPLAYRLRESGEGLSTGQKQRLMLARALLRDPLILVLDEMSANLDRASEAEIRELIAKLSGCTIITVSHRLDFVKGTHRIIELNNS